MATGDRQKAVDAATFAGFTGEALKTIVAIGGAESGWNPKAHNAVPPDDSYGVWQINMLGSLGPERRAKFGLSSNSELFDPVVNARAAWEISSHGSNFKPWSTYTNGAYKKHMTGAGSDVSPPNTLTAPAIPDIPGAITGGFNAFTSQLTKLASNVTVILLAVVLLTLGVLLIKGHTIGGAAKTIAGVASPVGKVGKVAKVAATAVSTSGGTGGAHRA